MPDVAGRAEGPVPAIASVRAQLLATEHWSLLASRSTTQGEVLTRISMFLMLTSAALLSVALVGQATAFDTSFQVFAVAVLAILNVVGTLTLIRVFTVAIEDLMYVLAMNRLRAAYLDLDPGIAPYLMASVHDDQPGSQQSYDFFNRRGTFVHVGGSSMVFIAAVCGALFGLLASSIAVAFDAATVWVYLIGFVLGVAYFVFAAARGGRSYFEVWQRHVPYSPTPPSAGAGTRAS